MQEQFAQLFDGWLAGSGVFMVSLLRVLAIALAAWVALRLLGRVSALLREGISVRIDDPESIKRAETLSRVLRYVVTVAVYGTAGMLILTEMGVSVAPILGAAGVVGLAVGFGAQSLVKDFVTGFFLLLENQIRQGDAVKLGNHAGTVENVTLRYVQLRDYEGSVHFVPNGTISTVINMSRGFGQAVVEVKVRYGAKVDQVMETMREVADDLAADPAFAPRILGAFELAGLDRLEDTGVVIRGRFQTLPNQQAGIRREYLRRLKNEFDARSIAFPGS